MARGHRGRGMRIVNMAGGLIPRPLRAQSWRPRDTLVLKAAQWCTGTVVVEGEDGSRQSWAGSNDSKRARESVRWGRGMVPPAPG